MLVLVRTPSPNLYCLALARSLSTEWMENLSEWTESCLVDGRGASRPKSTRVCDLTVVQWTGHHMARCFKLPAGSWITLPTMLPPFLKPRRYIYLSSWPKTLKTPSTFRGITFRYVHLTSRNSRSALRAIASWLGDPAWLRVSSNVLVDIQSYETSGAGMYNDHYGYVITLLKGRQIFPSQTSVLDYHNFSRQHWVLHAAGSSTPMFTSSKKSMRAYSSNSGTS